MVTIKVGRRFCDVKVEGFCARKGFTKDYTELFNDWFEDFKDDNDVYEMSVTDFKLLLADIWGEVSNYNDGVETFVIPSYLDGNDVSYYTLYVNDRKYEGIA